MHILFIFLLIVFPFAELLRVTLSNGISLIGNDIIVALVVCSWVGLQIQQKKLYFIIKDSIWKPLMLFISLAVISLLINVWQLNVTELLPAGLYLLRWIMYAGLYFVAKDVVAAKKIKAFVYLVVVGLIVVFFGYIQFLFYPNLRNLYYLGWDPHLYRMFSTFLDPNFAGVFFVLVLFLIFGLLFYFWDEKNNKNKLLFLFSFLITFSAVVFTYSRSAVLMLLTGLVILLLLKKKIKYLFFFLLGSVGFLLLTSNIFKSEGTNMLRTTSSLARFTTSQHALTIIQDHPIFGVGFNAYRYVQKKYGFLEKDTWSTNHAGAGVDNSFLFIFATTGIFGFSAYIFLWYILLRKAFHVVQQKDKFKKTIAIICISSTIGLFTSSIFINSLFYPFVMEWIWLLFGFMDYT